MTRPDLFRHLRNIPGWCTNRKIIIIESDDWGSIRMPSRKVFNFLTGMGILKDDEPFGLFDHLASSEDLYELFELLHSFKDMNGNPVAFTAVCVVANPDFKKIKENNFKEYYYEPFTSTLDRYFPGENIFDIWKKGIKARIFLPQFHGREHLNVGEWMRALQQGDKETHVCFDHEVWAFTKKENNVTSISFQAPFDFYFIEDLVIQRKAIEEGLKLFLEIFEYEAEFFVPAEGPFSTFLEEITAVMGIKYISKSKIQKEPKGLGKNGIRYHWLGQSNNYQQIYTTRNCHFEPVFSGKDWVDSCMRDIEIAFRWHKPAIISSHRVNYIGTHDQKNRDHTLKQIRLLITSILKKWQDIEFMTSNQLGEIIASERKY